MWFQLIFEYASLRIASLYTPLTEKYFTWIKEPQQLVIVSPYMPLSDLSLAKFFSRLPDVLVLWSLDCLHDCCVRRFAANQDSILLSHQIHFCCLTSYQWFEKLRVDWEKLRDWLHVSLHHLQFTSIVFFFSPNEPDGLEVQRKWSVFKNWENKKLKN